MIAQQHDEHHSSHTCERRGSPAEGKAWIRRLTDVDPGHRERLNTKSDLLGLGLSGKEKGWVRRRPEFGAKARTAFLKVTVLLYISIYPLMMTMWVEGLSARPPGSSNP
jgi:hypothetical protein